MPAPSRSSVFAFRSQGMHPQLDRFNAALGNNSICVTQLYSTMGDDQQILACFRTSKAVPHTRIISMLRWVEVKHGVDFKPIPGSTWTDSVFMGDAVRNGEGTEILDTLRQHMQEGKDSYKESISDNMHHNTHMLRDPIRERLEAPRQQNAPVPSEPPQGSAQILERTESLITLPPVDSPRSVEDIVINIPRELPNGQPDPVRASMEMAQRISNVVQDYYGLPPGYDVPWQIEQLSGLVRELIEAVRANNTRA